MPRERQSALRKAQVRPPSEELLREAIDKNGRYDAAALAEMLDWTKQEIAGFLGTDPSALSRQPAAPKHQDNLARLAATLRHLLDHTGNDLAQARAWLRTPILALDGKAPKAVIMEGRLDMIADLLGEIDSGFAA